MVCDPGWLESVLQTLALFWSCFNASSTESILVPRPSSTWRGVWGWDYTESWR